MALDSVEIEKQGATGHLLDERLDAFAVFFRASAGLQDHPQTRLALPLALQFDLLLARALPLPLVKDSLVSEKTCKACLGVCSCNQHQRTYKQNVLECRNF